MPRSSDGGTSQPVHESSLIRRRREEMRANERIAPYLYGFVMAIIVVLMALARPSVYALIPLGIMLALAPVLLLRPRVGRLESIGQDHLVVELNGELVPLYFDEIAKCRVVPLAWDDSGNAPFMKSAVRVTVTLSPSPGRPRRVMLLDGRDRVIRVALASAGLPVRPVRWASKYVGESGADDE